MFCYKKSQKEMSEMKLANNPPGSEKRAGSNRDMSIRLDEIRVMNREHTKSSNQEEHSGLVNITKTMVLMKIAKPNVHN